MIQTQEHCSTPDQLLALLRGQLSSIEESGLQQHLDDCMSCRERLENAAADVSVWNEAKQFFGNGGLHASSEDSTSGLEEVTQESHRIRQVLDGLRPSDDSDSLGRIGGYEVTGVVGAGGMGVVLKAHDRSLDRIVAIKVMSPHLASSGSARKRFAREAKAAAAVLHPNVIAIHSVASEDASPYLVMPYVRGASLQKRIDLQGPLPLKDTLRIGAQIAAGLAAAHEQGLVHRDIKPANILLEEGVERVTITDFGLARAVDDASMTCSGVIAGTPQYMSPEQTRGEPIDARSDLFSLGSVLYAMCTGRSPFRAETTYGVLHRIANDNPTPVCEVNSDIPDWLGHIIERLMAKRPDNRFETAAQVAALLEGCLAHVQQPAAMPLPEAVANLAPKRVRRTPIWKYIAAAVFALSIIFAGVMIVLELDKGTLTIESELENVPIRIMKGDKIVERLTVTQSGNSVRVAAGTYVVELETKFDGMVVENDRVSLKRGGTEHVMIRLSTRNSNARADVSNQPTMENTDSVATYSAPDSKPKIIIDLYGGKEVLGQMNTTGPNKTKHTKLFHDLNAIEGVQVNFREAGPGNEIASVIVSDPGGLLNQEALTIGKPSARRDAISKALEQIPSVRWDEGGLASVRPSDGKTPAADEVNMLFGETREVVLSMGTLQCMLNLDAGETCPAPARIGGMINRFDVRPTQDQPHEEPRGLTIPNHGTTSETFEALSVADELWDLTDFGVLSALSTSKLKPVHEIPLREGFPRTYFFRTAPKAHGLLQLIGTERIQGAANEPWGIRIRYKLLRLVDFERETKAVTRTLQYLSAVQENDTETIKAIAKGLAKHERREKSIAKLLQESGVPKHHKTLFVNHSAVVARGPVSSSDEQMNGRFLLFTLSLVDERWSIVDIDLEDKESLLERFNILTQRRAVPDTTDQSLQGVWDFISVESDGVVTEYKSLTTHPSAAQLTIAGDMWMVNAGTGSGGHRVNVDGNKLTFYGLTTSMPGTGASIDVPTIGYGLFKLDGDSLVYVMTPATAGGESNGQNEPQIKFPESFETKGTGNNVFRLRKGGAGKSTAREPNPSSKVPKESNPFEARSLDEVTSVYNERTRQLRAELFNPPIPDLTTEQMQAAMLDAAEQYRKQGKVAIASALKTSVETNRLADQLTFMGMSGTMSEGFRQITPTFHFGVAGNSRLSVVIPKAELRRSVNGWSSKTWGDIHPPINGKWELVSVEERGATLTQVAFNDWRQKHASWAALSIDAKSLTMAGDNATKFDFEIDHDAGPLPQYTMSTEGKTHYSGVLMGNGFIDDTTLDFAVDIEGRSVPKTFHTINSNTTKLTYQRNRRDGIAPTADKAYQAMEKLISNPKMDGKSTERYTAIVATRMTSDIEFAKYVQEQFQMACAGGESTFQARRYLLDVLARAFHVLGQSRWSSDLVSSQQHFTPIATGPREILDLERSALESVVTFGRKATRSDIVDFVRTARASHHPDALPFLRDVLQNSQLPPPSPYASPQSVPTTDSNQSTWSDNIGGTWPDATFIAAVGLAEQGDALAVEWMLDKAKPNDFGLDMSINQSRHKRDRSGSLRESSRCAVADLFGQSQESTADQLSDWWKLNRSQFVPRAVGLKSDATLAASF